MRPTSTNSFPLQTSEGHCRSLPGDRVSDGLELFVHCEDCGLSAFDTFSGLPDMWEIGLLRDAFGTSAPLLDDTRKAIGAAIVVGMKFTPSRGVIHRYLTP
jgi:hypothetical protein